MALNMSSVVKQLIYVWKLFRVTAGNIYSFRIRSKENASDNISKLLWSKESTSIVHHLDQ